MRMKDGGPPNRRAKFRVWSGEHRTLNEKDAEIQSQKTEIAALEKKSRS
jgi:hypothetical protein